MSKLAGIVEGLREVLTVAGFLTLLALLMPEISVVASPGANLAAYTTQWAWAMVKLVVKLTIFALTSSVTAALANRAYQAGYLLGSAMSSMY